LPAQNSIPFGPVRSLQGLQRTFAPSSVRQCHWAAGALWSYCPALILDCTTRNGMGSSFWIPSRNGTHLVRPPAGCSSVRNPDKGIALVADCAAGLRTHLPSPNGGRNKQTLRSGVGSSKDPSSVCTAECTLKYEKSAKSSGRQPLTTRHPGFSATYRSAFA
jgi:hypothetical protein